MALSNAIASMMSGSLLDVNKRNQDFLSLRLYPFCLLIKTVTFDSPLISNSSTDLFNDYVPIMFFIVYYRK